MTTIQRRIAMAAAALCLFALAALPARAIDGDRFGEIQLLTPTGPERGMVIMFSGAAGWGPTDQAAAETLAKAGALVAEIDSRYYQARLNQIDEPCHVLIGDTEALSREIQRKHGSGNYHSPILFGVGQGGAFAEAILAQARANTLAGAVSVDTTLDPGTQRPICSDVVKMVMDPAVVAQGPKALQGFWIAAFRPDAPGKTREHLMGWAKGGVSVDITDVTADASVANIVAQLVVPHLEVTSSAADADAVSALPLVELPAGSASDRMVIILSGDGGWRDIDKTLADKLHADGISVVGWDSLHYFWRAKTPDRLAADLAAVIRHYRAQWHPKQIALIGYSFGADVLPFAYNRLPPDLRSKVSLMSLLAFSKAADFEISVTGWLGASPTKAALPLADEAAQLPVSMVQCFYGEGDDDESGCPDLKKMGAEVIRTRGGHHFDGDYDDLAQRIILGLAQRTATESPSELASPR
jgi:type IV secretory pathway VirJ component